MARLLPLCPSVLAALLATSQGGSPTLRQQLVGAVAQAVDSAFNAACRGGDAGGPAAMVLVGGGASSYVRGLSLGAS